MLNWLTKIFRSAPSEVVNLSVEAPQDMPGVQWRTDSAFPIPRGQAFRVAIAQKHPEDAKNYWRALFQQWFVALAPTLQAYSDYAPNGFRWIWRGDFILLSPLDERRTNVMVQYCTRFANRIYRSLPGLAQPSQEGALAVIIFPDAHTYDHYCAHFYGEEGGIASAGMFVIQNDDVPMAPNIHGFGHFLVLADEVDQAEPTLMHELTHALLSHLDLPLWINEGIATLMERSIEPALDPAYVMNRRIDLLRRHRLYWDAQSIPGFWNGSAFHHGDSSELAYDMAYKIVSELARDMPTFSSFAKAAAPADGGARAAAEIYQLPLDLLLEAHLQRDD